ncbi:MAG: Endonuclease/Exonuclease/phosphatase family protein [Schlesneria sp.]|nr:Endonuclease/Exonuclease/phosphatase family protein [Schlesneria sp.]
MSVTSTDSVLNGDQQAGRPGRLWIRCLWTALIGLNSFAFTVHWVVRDHSDAFSVFYYATPAVLIGVGALITAWIGVRLRWPKSSFAYSANGIMGLVAILCCGEWAMVDFRWNSKEVAPDSIKVVFWNVGRGHIASWDRIAKQVQNFDADVIALTEATSDEVQTRDYWKARLPEYSVYPLQEGLVLLTKGSAVERLADSTGGLCDYRHLSVTAGRHNLDIILADVPASMLLLRRKPITALYSRIKTQAVPTLMIGDLNTPPSSVWFDEWRRNWTRAWDAAGSGYQSTWPQPLPVLALDHIWGNRGITFQRCTCGWSSCSDHRPVIANIVVNEAMNSERNGVTGNTIIQE